MDRGRQSDAMVGHFMSDENSYSPGHGTEFKYDRNREATTTKLHISNIPFNINEDGLTSIFEAEGISVSSAFVSNNKVSKSGQPVTTTWGFVACSSLREAQAAITALNKKPPHNLFVKYAKTEEEKLEEKNRQDDSDRHSVLHMSTRGRGQLPPMHGRPPSDFRSTRTTPEEFLNDPKPNDYSGKKFSHPDSTYETSNAVHAPLADGYYVDDGLRKMSMGRGSFVKPLEENQERFHSTSLIRYQCPDIQDGMDSKVAAYISKKFKELTVEDNMKVSSALQLTMPFKLGPCTYCNRSSIYCCTRCKAWYCSYSCREDDYSQHRKLCAPRTLYFKPDGEVTFSNALEMFQDAEDSSSTQNRSHQVRGLPAPLTDRHSDDVLNKSDHFNGTSSRDKVQAINENSSFNNSFDGDNSGGTAAKRNPRGNDTNKNRDFNRDSNRGAKRNIDSSTDNQRDINRDSRRDNQRDFNRDSPRDNLRDSNRESCGDNQRDNNRDGHRDNKKDLNRESHRDNQKDNRENNKQNKRSSFGQKGNRSPADDDHLDRHRNSRGQNDRRSNRGRNSALENERKGRTSSGHEDSDSLRKPPIPMNTYTEVMVGSIAKDNKNEFFGFCKLDYQAQADIMVKLGQICIDAPSFTQVKVGQIVAAPFVGDWFRARVTDIDDSLVDVFFIDFGNTSTVKKSDLRRLPENLAEQRVLAYKFVLDASPENPVLEEELPLNLKPVRLDNRGRWVVQVEGVQYAEMKELDDGTELCEADQCPDYDQEDTQQAAQSHLLYNLASTPRCRVCFEYILNEEFLTGFIYEEDKQPIYLRIAQILKQSVSKSNNMRLTKGMNIAALWKNTWHRGYVVLTRGMDAFIALIDRGRVVTPEAVAPLPDFITYIAESSIRAIFKTPLQGRAMIGKEFTLKVIRQLEDQVFVDITMLGEAALVPWEPAIEDVGLSCIHLVSGTKVQISSYTSPKSVYLQSNSPENSLLRSEIIRDVANHCMHCGPLQRKPFSGEFLAARFADDGNFYRAQIYSRVGDLYKVTFVDFGNTAVVPTCDLRPLPDDLKLVPCCSVKVGLKGVPDVAFNTLCMAFLNELCADCVDLYLTYENDLQEVNLALNGGELVNHVLNKLINPSWTDPDFIPHGGDVFMMSDLNFEIWNRNEKFEAAFIEVFSANEVAVLRTDSDLIDFIEKDLTPRITMYCEKFPDETYNPRKGEVCIVKFHEDSKWYRAICLESSSYNSSKVSYIDYGNSGEVLHTFIRKMVPEFVETPVALKNCRVVGVPEMLPAEVENKLKEYYLSRKHFVEVVCDAEMPHIWLPELRMFADPLGIELKHP